MQLATTSNPSRSTAVSALIFDMDGTIVDSMPSHSQSWVEFAQRYGIDKDVVERVCRNAGKTGIECMHELFGRQLSEQEAQNHLNNKEQIYRDLFAPIFAEVAGFKPFVAHALQRGLRFGLGSAGDRHNIAFTLRHLQLPVPPEAIVGGDEGLPGKPQPDIFLKVARCLNVRPQECIVFEDAPLGIEAARRAGMQAVAICTSYSAAQLAGAHVVASANNYLELIESNFLETLHVATA